MLEQLESRALPPTGGTALKAAEGLSAEQHSLNRVIGHLKGKIYFLQGDYPKAMAQYEKTIKFYGEHIGILADIACIYYLDDNIFQWKNALAYLLKTFNQVEKKLSAKSYNKSAILIGKFLEETGNIAQAFLIVKQGLARIDPAISPNQYFICLAQRVRIQAIYQMSGNLGDDYSVLLAFNNNLGKNDTFIEIEHALMLAEIVLVGPHHAQERVSLLLANPQLSNNDKQLVFYDFLAQAIMETRTVPLVERPLFFKQGNFDAFETEIDRLVFSSNRATSAVYLTSISNKFSLANYLRLLCTVIVLRSHHAATVDIEQSKANKQPGRLQGDGPFDAALILELKKKMRLLFAGLAADSQVIWKNRVKHLFDHDRLVLKLDSLNGELHYLHQKVFLGKKKHMLALLELFLASDAIELEACVTTIWQCQKYNASYFDRLRIMVQRLNRLLFDLTTESKLIQVTKQTVVLRKGVGLIRLDG